MVSATSSFYAERGTNLFAVNIQRGRDHGLPSLSEMRDLLGLKGVRNCSDISTISAIAHVLAEAYGPECARVDPLATLSRTELMGPGGAHCRGASANPVFLRRR